MRHNFEKKKQLTPSLLPVADWLKGPIENSEGRGMSVRHGTGCFIGKENGTVADPGEGPPLLLDQNEARRAEKKLF